MAPPFVSIAETRAPHLNQTILHGNPLEQAIDNYAKTCDAPRDVLKALMDYGDGVLVKMLSVFGMCACSFPDILTNRCSSTWRLLLSCGTKEQQMAYAKWRIGKALPRIEESEVRAVLGVLCHAYATDLKKTTSSSFSFVDAFLEPDGAMLRNSQDFASPYKKWLYDCKSRNIDVILGLGTESFADYVLKRLDDMKNDFDTTKGEPLPEPMERALPAEKPSSVEDLRSSSQQDQGATLESTPLHTDAPTSLSDPALMTKLQTLRRLRDNGLIPDSAWHTLVVEMLQGVLKA